jgi:hypothetical protein
MAEVPDQQRQRRRHQCDGEREKQDLIGSHDEGDPCSAATVLAEYLVGRADRIHGAVQLAATKA